MELKVKVLSTSGFNQIKNALGAAGRKAVLRSIGSRLKEMTQENFGEEGPYRPEEWPPYQSGPREDEPVTLIKTGALRRSIYVNVTDRYAEVGSDVEYSDYHQYGTSEMPPRPFFPIRGTRSGNYKLIPEAQDEVEKVAYAVFIREMTK